MIKAAVITAAGLSSRMQGKGKKELYRLKGRTVLEQSVLPFVLSEEFNFIVVTYPAGKEEDLKKALHHINFPIFYVQGGKTRQESVRNALLELDKNNTDIVLIHDGARPHISETLIMRVLQRTVEQGNGTPVVPSTSAMKLLSPEGDIESHLKRDRTFSAQTPQGFSFREILDAHNKANEDKGSYIDDSEIWSVYVGPAHTVEGDPENIKITYPGDLRK